MIRELKHSLHHKAPSRRKATLWRVITSWTDQGTLIVIGLLLLPLYFKILGAEKYGYWLASGGILVWIGMLDMTAITGQRASNAYGKKDLTTCVSYLWTGLAFNLLILLPVIYAGYLMGGEIPNWLSAPESLSQELTRAFQIGVLAVAIQYFCSCSNSFLNAIQRPVAIAVARPIAATAQIVTIFYGLYHGWGLLAIPTGLLARNLIIGAQGVAYSCFLAFLLVPRLVVSRHVFKDYCKTGPAVMLNVLSTGVGQKIQPTLITLFLSAEAAAAYDATLRVGMLISTTTARLSLAAFPSFSHLLGSERSERVRTLLKNCYLGILAISTLGLGGYAAFNQSFVYLWLQDAPFAGQSVTLLAAIWLLTLSIGSYIFTLYLSFGAINASMLIKTTGTVVQVLLAVVLLKFTPLGLLSLPLAALIATLGMIGLNFHFFTLDIREQIPKLRFLAPRALGAMTLLFLSGLAPLLWVPGTWLSFGLSATGYTAIVGLALLGIYHKALLSLIKNKTRTPKVMPTAP
ncbi:hypothetical protein H5P28_15220 [Ruficoccus amylovorans]|uniref:Polysaccharide biosynthesis protein n=1 Tax=Ruficoccus amylovorans TaxID=1804625 RepID=A0A842HJE8_9BACT|nr:hypothetical protein [Ruficoccus amylovorans]MBC2595617.1 hypothetical protein [Ruficoccus amylovorans]